MTPSSPPLPPLPGGAGTDPARADLGAEDRPFVGLATARAIAGVGP